jgi:hypothetical protein
MRTYLLFLIILFVTNLPLLSQSIHSELKNLSENADAILTGKVIEQKAEWNMDKTRIFTTVTIEVDEYLKGSNSQSRITVTHPGGEVGEVGEIYSHVPTFLNDENVLLFVKQNRNDMSFRVLEGEVGKISLAVDKLTGEKVTANNKNISAYKKEIRSYLKTQ